MISDEEAYRRYLRGEHSAASILVERYGDALTLYLNGCIRNLHDAEDLMIETFSRIFAKERPIADDGSFKAYLYKTARNLALRHTRHRRLHLLHIEELSFELPGDALAETELFSRERDRQLYAALEQIKDEYREALFLVYFEGLSYRDAAKVMGKNEQQFNNLVYRGKRSLKTALEKEGFVYADE